MAPTAIPELSFRGCRKGEAPGLACRCSDPPERLKLACLCAVTDHVPHPHHAPGRTPGSDPGAPLLFSNHCELLFCAGQLSPGSARLPAPGVCAGTHTGACQSSVRRPGLTWPFLLQKRSTRMNVLGSQSPLHPSTLSAGQCTPQAWWAVGPVGRACCARAHRPCFPPSVIHRTQQWFHGRITREESHRIIKQQGLVDG